MIIWHWHRLGPTMRKTFYCDVCRRHAAWGKRRTPGGRSERMLCTQHVKLDPDWTDQ